MGEIIRNRRKAIKMSQEELAKALGVTQGNVSQWENGDSMPRINKLEKLAEVLGIDVKELLLN